MPRRFTRERPMRGDLPVCLATWVCRALLPSNNRRSAVSGQQPEHILNALLMFNLLSR